MADFDGVWQSFYRYPSSGRGDDFWGRHDLFATQADKSLRLESGADSTSHVVMELELDADGEMARGVWREHTDPDGHYGGREYEGTVELRVATNGNRMNGVWHGAGKDGTMHSDIWELAKTDSEGSVDLPKRWKLTHWYPSGDDSREESDEHEMKSYWHDGVLVLESLPRDDGGYMLARLRVQDGVATGGWYENASLTGENKGAQYSGAGQLTVDVETHRMEGLWAGAGYNHKLKKMEVYTGRWEIEPIG